MWVGVDVLFLQSEQLDRGPRLEHSEYAMDHNTEMEVTCLAEVECSPLQALSQNQAAAALRDGLDWFRLNRKSPTAVLSGLENSTTTKRLSKRLSHIAKSLEPVSRI